MLSYTTNNAGSPITITRARCHLFSTGAVEAAIAADPKWRRPARAYRIRYVVDAIVRQRLGVARIAGARSKTSRLHSKALKRAIGNDYFEVLEWLMDSNLLDTDGYYVRGEKAKGYWITNKGWRGEIVPVEMTESQRGRYDRARARLRRESDAQRNQEGVPLDYMRLHLGALSFEEVALRSYFEEMRAVPAETYQEAERRYSHSYAAALVAEKDWTFHRCAAGRLHYPLTNLPKEIRRMLLYNGENLVEVDVKSCQPFLAACLYGEKQREERRQYLEDVIEGRFYEMIGTKAAWQGSRDELKKAVLSRVFFGSREQACGAVWDAFKALYPGLSGIIQEGKQNLLPWRGDRELALKLQRMESRVVIDGALQRIAREMPAVPALPIHDCMMTTRQNVERVLGVLSSVFKSEIGLVPSFSREAA